MKKLLLEQWKVFFLFGMFASLVVISSCSDDDDPVEEEEMPTETLLQLIESTDNLDSLSKYVNRYPSLIGALSAGGDNTFFAPTNEAFVNLLQTPDFPSGIDLINPDIIEGVIAYHIVLGQAVAQADFNSSVTLSTLYTDPATETVQTITFSEDGTQILTGSTSTDPSVATADIAATNGIMHTTNFVLIPPSVGETLTPILGTLASSVLLGADFSILAEGILKADAGKDAAATIAGALTAVTDLTVFAPTNATFNAGLEGDGSNPITVDSYDAATWDAIIRNHVVVGMGGGTDDGDNTLGPADLTTGSVYTTLGGGTLTIFNNTDAIPPMNGIGIYIDSNGDVDLADQTTYGNFNAEVALPDAVNISQGRIHVIAGVLSPL